jgi:hypothetical protein
LCNFSTSHKVKKHILIRHLQKFEVAVCEEWLDI